MRICSESAVFPCLTDQALPRSVRSFDNKKALVLATLSGEYMLQVERNTASAALRKQATNPPGPGLTCQ